MSRAFGQAVKRVRQALHMIAGRHGVSPEIHVSGRSGAEHHGSTVTVDDRGWGMASADARQRRYRIGGTVTSACVAAVTRTGWTNGYGKHGVFLRPQSGFMSHELNGRSFPCCLGDSPHLMRRPSLCFRFVFFLPSLRCGRNTRTSFRPLVSTTGQYRTPLMFSMKDPSAFCRLSVKQRGNKIAPHFKNGGNAGRMR